MNIYSKVYEALNQFFTYYLIERNLEKTLSMVTDDIYSIGTGAHEIALDKASFGALVQKEIDDLPLPISYDIKNYHEKQASDSEHHCFCDVESSISLPDEGVIYFQTRLTASFKEVDGLYLASTFHMSAASSTQDKQEFFPLRYGSEELQKISTSSQQELLKLMMHMIPGGVMGAYVEPDFPLYIINDELLNLLGYTYEEFILDTKELMSNTIHPNDLNIVWDAVQEGLSKNSEYQIEYRIKKKDGTFIWVYDIGRKIITPDNRDAIVSIIMDISDSVSHNQQLTIAAMNDPLTNLYNRRYLTEYITQYFKEAKDCTFLILDIDNFKQVNDFYGHPIGDQLLCSLADLLKHHFHQTNAIARFGGDEFVIFIPQTSCIEQLPQHLNALSKSYRQKVQLLCPDSQSSLSFGGVYGTVQGDYDEIYAQADKLLYEVKQAGKGSYKIKSIQS